MLTKLGKYEIKAELGSGAMGVVYRAEDPRLGRPVALKTMSANVAGNPDLLKRFYREAQSAGQLRHPNIVTIYDIDEADGIPFIAMEFLEGEDLDKIITARKDVTVVKKLDIIIQACRGLHYAHQHGIVHRDVKPGNIVLLTDGIVKIVDFGIARIGATSMTRTGMVLGTVMYMSPEQVRGQTVDPRSDIFSLGIILYELLTYQSPFPGKDVPSILFKILNEPPLAITELLPNCPSQLEKIVLRALEKDREQRYQTAEDLAFDVQRIADSLRRDMVEIYLKQGQASFEQHNLTVAKESLQKVLEIDSSHGLAKSLLEQVQKELYTRQRTQKVEQSLRQAKEALQAEQYEDALHVLEEILRVDPKHEEAQQYKQMAVERRDRGQKVARHLERAEKLAADTDFQAAKTELEAVLGVDRSHSGALKMMDWVLKELTEQERLRQVRQYTQTARTHLAEKNYAKALELLDKARQLDPINIEVDSLTRLVQSSQEKESRRQGLDTLLTDIQEKLNREQFDQALSLADKALQDFPDDPQVLKLHAQAGRRADVHKKRRYVDEQLKAARDFFQKNQFSSAVAVLERAIQAVPDDARLASFLKSVQEAQEGAELETIRREAIREANEQVRAKNFSAAIETLEKALARAGQSPELTQLLQLTREQWAEMEKEERVSQVMGRAQAALLEEDFDEAIRLLERGQRELAAPAIGELLATAREQALAFRRRREDVVARAQELLKAGDAVKAVALMDDSPKAFFKDEAFQRAYTACREGLDRATFVRMTAEQVEKALASEDITQAEALLQHALETYPNDATLQASQKRLREEQARLRQFQWSKLLDEAKVAMGRMQFKQAIDLLTSTPWDASGIPEVATQAKALLEEARRREQEATKRRPAMRPAEVPTAAKRAAVAAPAVAPPKAAGVPTAVWVLAGVLGLVVVVGLGGYAVWRYGVRTGGGTPGYVELTAAPWAEVTSVQKAGGERLNITGQTPLRVQLPPGEYVIELKNGETTGKVNVVVESGKAVPLHYTFPEVKVDALVEELVSQY